MSVYFAQVGPHIKIGYSANPERRVRRLFASATRYGTPEGTPLDLASRHLIRTIDGDTQTEHAIRQSLDDFALGLEWFADEPEVRDFIATATTRTRYAKVRRPGGPIQRDYVESRDLPADEYRQLVAALDGMFANTT